MKDKIGKTSQYSYKLHVNGGSETVKAGNAML